ncbi:hypothetical protein BST20_27820 [Mycobacterium branderi]|uniref:Uncharacterized protein n=1 Tax=Mycobacterium branderi TaxID=43348 RepID=A0AA91RFC7_9MYCO|nr:hypothetical protein BST20_27820 [Mycobacterium branderi]
MPSRPYSSAILGGLWPTTDPDAWSDAGEGLQHKANELEDDAATIRRSAEGLYTDGSGEMIDGMHGACIRQSHTVMDMHDSYASMAKSVNETARVIYSTRSALDAIDEKANEEIKRLKEANKGRGLSAAGMSMLLNAIAEIVAQARAEAQAKAATAAGEIAKCSAQIGGGAGNGQGAANNGAGSDDPPVDPELQAMVNAQAGPGGGRGIGNMPRGRLGEIPQTPPDGPLPASPGSSRGGQEPSVYGQDPMSNRGGQEPSVNGTNPSEVPGGRESNVRPGSTRGGQEPGIPSVPQMPQLPTPGGAGGGGGGGSPMGGLGGLGKLSGGMPGGLGSGATPPLNAGGLPNASGLTPPATPGMPSATPADFSRGFDAGLGAAGGAGPSAASALPPPVSSAPPPVASTAGAAGAPPPVTPAAGPPTAAAPPAAAPVSTPTPTGGGGMGGAMIPPAVGGGGPLPPLGSDVPARQVVSPAAGPPPPAAGPPPSAPATPAAAPAAPLPPGVVASGVGATAAGAGVGLRSNAPDPLLEEASSLVYELMHASRVYGCIDWCVGVFKTPSGTQKVIVSNEGVGYIPPGVFVPRSAQMLFSDAGLPSSFRARWFAWVNPAQTMLAYAELCAESNPNIELYALAVSTDHGGSAIPAREAGIRHYEDCSLAVSPIDADSSPPSLDESRMHRLETLDRAEYVRLTSVSRPDRSMVWPLTESVVRSVLVRASGLLGLSVPPVIRQVATALSESQPITDEQWDELEVAGRDATFDSASQRPGRVNNDMASPYARAYYSLARAAELLLMWRGSEPEYAEIAYVARQISVEAQLWPSGAE